jgi:hypothetical protein
METCTSEGARINAEELQNFIEDSLDSAINLKPDGEELVIELNGESIGVVEPSSKENTISDESEQIIPVLYDKLTPSVL